MLEKMLSDFNPRQIGGRWMFSCPVPLHGKGQGDRNRSAEAFVDPEDSPGVVCYAGCDNWKLFDLVVRPYALNARYDNADEYLIAVYEHPDGRARKVFRRDYPGQCDRKDCDKRKDHKHIWQTKGDNKGCFLLLWGNETDKDPVVIVEGEKSAAAIASEGYTGASWIGGTGMTQYADYRQLKGRSVLVMPDYDVAGEKAAMKAAREAYEWATSVAILPAVETEDGADAADLSAAELRAHIEAGGQPYRPELETPPSKAGPNRPFGEFDCTPLAEAQRLIVARAPFLLAVRDNRKGADPDHYLQGDNGAGCWSDRHAELQEHVSRNAREWGMESSKLYIKGEVTQKDLRDSLAWSKRGQGPAGWQDTFRSIGPAIVGLELDGELPPDLTQAMLTDLDTQLRYIGAPNGVIDLDTGLLLVGADARAKLVTRTIPDAYHADAKHPDIDSLLGHLGAANQEWILSAFGYALRGNPNRRIYFFEGPPGGGKTTLLNAVRACLGSVKAGGYAFALDGNALVSDRANSNAHTSHLVDFPYGRIATASDLPTNRRMDSPMLKKLSGTEFLAHRDVGQRSEPDRIATATMFIAVNPGALADAMDLSDDALFERVRVLPYPALPPDRPRDSDLAHRVTVDEHVRQAMLALLVQHAAANRHPPEDVPSVAAARSTARDTALGEAGDWIRSHVVRGQPGMILLTTDLWSAALAAGGEADGERAWGLTRRQFMKRVNGLGMNPAGRVTRRGRGWRDWRLLTDEEVAAEDPACPPECQMVEGASEAPCTNCYRPAEGWPCCENGRDRDCHEGLPSESYWTDNAAIKDANRLHGQTLQAFEVAVKAVDPLSYGIAGLQETVDELRRLLDSGNAADLAQRVQFLDTRLQQYSGPVDPMFELMVGVRNELEAAHRRALVSDNQTRLPGFARSH